MTPFISLADECEVITKGTTPTTLGFTFEETGVPFIRVQNLVDGTVSVSAAPLFISTDTHAALKRSQIESQDILISIAGTIGRAAIVPSAAGPMNCNQAVAIVRPTKRIDRRFMLHWLATADAMRQMAMGKVTGTISNLSLEQIGNLKVPLPQLNEQRQIAAILDKADALRRKRQRAIELLESLMNEFVDAAYEDTPPTVQIGELFDVQGGLQLTHARAKLPLELPYLRVANVYRNRLDLTEIKTMRVTQSELERTVLVSGDILFVEGHGNANEIGRCAVWGGAINPCVHQNHLIRARPASRDVDSFTLSRWLNGSAGRKYLLKRGKTTSGLNTINVSDVKATPIPVLRIAMQERLRSQIDTIDRVKAAFDRQYREFEFLFSSLQSRAFSGQL